MKMRTITDWFFPTLKPHENGYMDRLQKILQDYVQERQSGSIGDITRAQKWLQYEQQSLTDEKARNSRAKAKAEKKQTLIGGAIATGPFIGVVFWLLSAQTKVPLSELLGGFHRWFIVAVASLAVYAAIQAVQGAFAAQTGTAHRAYPPDPFPMRQQNETPDIEAVRHASALVRANFEWTQHTDAIMSQTNLAATCERNLLVAGVALTVLVGSILVVPNVIPAASEIQAASIVAAPAPSVGNPEPMSIKAPKANSTTKQGAAGSSAEDYDDSEADDNSSNPTGKASVQ